MSLTQAHHREAQTADHPECILICPDERRRRVIAEALAKCRARVIREVGAYPTDGAAELLGRACDAIIVEIDSDPGAGLQVVERLAQHSTATVMVYSGSAAADLLVRSMRAGAREILGAEGFGADRGVALARAPARRAETAGRRKSAGKLMVFWGAKGGVGVTTLAANFAIGLQKEAGAEVALVDLNIHLGGVAVLLGIAPQFTVLDAFRHEGRLDGEFVSQLATKYRPNLSVFASADEYVPSVHVENGTVGKLLNLLRSRYEYVVVDAGPGLGSSTEALFEAADALYVVTQLDIPSLRNAQRFLEHRKRAGQQGLEVVLNRFEPRKLEYDEERIAKAIGMAPKWKVPNDYASVRTSLNTGSPAALENSPVSRALAQMARAACGKLPARDRDRKAKPGFLGLAW